MDPILQPEDASPAVFRNFANNLLTDAARSLRKLAMSIHSKYQAGDMKATMQWLPIYLQTWSSADIYDSVVTVAYIFTDKSSYIDSSAFNSIKLKLTTAMWRKFWYIILTPTELAWQIPIARVQRWDTPYDGELTCPKHVKYFIKQIW